MTIERIFKELDALRTQALTVGETRLALRLETVTANLMTVMEDEEIM